MQLSYGEWQILVETQRLAIRHPSQGINADNLALMSPDDLMGIHSHLRRVDRLQEA